MNIKAWCLAGAFFISLGVNANEDNRYPDFNDVANTSYLNKRQGSSSQQRELLYQNFENSYFPNSNNLYPNFSFAVNKVSQQQKQENSSPQSKLLNQQEQAQNSQNSIDVSAQNEDNKQQSNVDELTNSLAKKSVDKSYMAQSCYNPAHNAQNVADASAQNEDSKQQRTITDIAHLLAESIVYRAWQDLNSWQYWNLLQGYYPNCACPYCAYPFYGYGMPEQ